MHKGYSSELIAKKELIKEFGKENVIKVAIGGAQDYIILQRGRLKKVVEVKECHQKKYCPSSHNKEQMLRMLNFCREHEVRLELWIHYPNQKRWNKIIKYDL